VRINTHQKLASIKQIHTSHRYSVSPSGSSLRVPSSTDDKPTILA
jgi:hypothetical protein